MARRWRQDRIASLGKPTIEGAATDSGSWPEISADLNSLTETDIDQDGKRCPVLGAASLALRAAGVVLPPTVRQLAGDWPRRY